MAKIKTKTMSNSETWAVALIYLGFFGLVGAAIWMTGTAWPLWALILMPTINAGGGKGERAEENVEE